MRRPPTDLEIVRTIYNQHLSDFIAEGKDWQTLRATKIYVPIDIRAVADKLRVHPEIIFGALHYQLQPKHGLKYKENDENDVEAPLFQIGWPAHIKANGGFYASERHIVHFTMLASIYANLQQQHSRATVAIWISAASLTISLLSLVIAASSLYSQTHRPPPAVAPVAHRADQS